MEPMSLQEFEDLLISTEVWGERMMYKWEDIVNKLSCYYYYLAEEIEEKLPQTADYYREKGDHLFMYLYDRKYYD